jgi:hypothetical protein
MANGFPHQPHGLPGSPFIDDHPTIVTGLRIDLVDHYQLPRHLKRPEEC